MTEATHARQTTDEELLGAQAGAVIAELSDEERLERIDAELERGFDALRDVTRGVSVFGSARLPPDAPEYELARDVAQRSAAAGFTVITGGGPGSWRPPTAAPGRPARARSA